MSDITLLSISASISHCKSCRAAIQWAKTERGAAMPLNAGAPWRQDPDGMFRVDNAHTHWVICPARKAFQKGAGRGA